MEAKTATPDRIFRVFTACPNDTRTLIVDVRSAKEYKKLHILSSYNVRLAADGKALLDYSRNTYDFSWSKDCWWDKHVIVYGDEKLRKDHPVVAFLCRDNHAKTLHIYKEGFEAFAKLYPYVCTASTKANALRRYPSEIIPSLLYLGDWAHAENWERLNELNIKRVLTIHNNPDNLKVPANIEHRKYEMADVETQDISPLFSPSFDFIEEARAKQHAVLVHCGAGVSRSAALVVAYLMRRFHWSAAKARSYCVERRSLVSPNDGFWRSLCALEVQLGIADRSNPEEGGGHGLDAPVTLANDAAGEKVIVTFVPVGRPQAGDQPSATGSRRPDAAGEQPERQRSGREAEPGSRGEGRGRNERDDRRRDEDGRRHSPDRDSVRHGDDRRRSHHDRDDRLDRKHDRRERERDERDRDDRGDRKRSRDDRHEHRDRSQDAGGEPRQRGREGRAQQPDEEPKSTGRAAPAAAEARPGVVLQLTKEGRVAGQLEISLHKSNQRCMIGRTPQCDLHLEHASVSRQHAQLTTDAAGNLYITDLGSAHGTNVNGTWIRAKAPRQLMVGAVVKFGASTREYKVLNVPKDAKQKAAAAD